VHSIDPLSRAEFLRKLGARIRQLRQLKGFTQEDLAAVCHKNQQSIHRLENARINPSAYYLHQIAVGLEVEISELFRF
jgi:putative transcriptional regulator